MPAEREEVLNWYKNFRRQMKEEFHIDISRKSDLFRLRSVYRREDDGTSAMKYPFIRQNEDGSYAVPKPELDADEIKGLVGMYDRLQKKIENSADPDHDPEIRAYYAEIGRKSELVHKDRHQWEIGSQTSFDPEREEDFAQIARLYENAKDGSLFLMNGHNFKDSVPLYLGDDGRMHAGPSAGAPAPTFEVAPGVTMKMQDIFKYAHQGRAEITENMSAFERNRAVSRNQCADLLDRIYPEREAVNDTDYKAFDHFQFSAGSASMPKPVSKPGILAYIRWIFSGFSDDSEVGAYNRYVTERNEKLQYRERIARSMKQYGQMEARLVETGRKVEGVADRDRAYSIYANQDAIASLISHPHQEETERICDSIEEHLEDGEMAPFSNDYNMVLNAETKNLLCETEDHPEYFNPNGTRSSAGRTAYRNRTYTPEEKEAAFAGYREQLAQAKREALEFLDQTFENEYIETHTAEKTPFIHTLGILLYVSAMEERIQKGELFRECEMKAGDIKATGRALTDTGAFRAMTDAMPDVRGGMFEIMRMERHASPELPQMYATMRAELAEYRKALDAAKQQPAAEKAEQKQAEKAADGPEAAVLGN